MRDPDRSPQDEPGRARGFGDEPHGDHQSHLADELYDDAEGSRPVQDDTPHERDVHDAEYHEADYHEAGYQDSEPYDEYGAHDEGEYYDDQHYGDDQYEHPDDHRHYDDEHQDAQSLGVVTRGKRRRRGVAALVLVLCLALVGGAAWFGMDQVRQVVSSISGGPEDYPGPGSGEVTVVINDGDTGRAIGNTLEEAGVVKTSSAFVAALTDANAANAMQPGTYRLHNEMSAAGAVALLQNPASRVNIQVRLREGLWKSEAFAAISEETGFTAEELEAAAQDPSVGLPPEAGGDIEGYLFPATYTFQPDVTPVQIMQQLVAKYKEEMTKANVPAAQQRHVLIVASLVQAEASDPDDFPRVARVVENRTEKGMKLEFDTTVNFALQKRGFALTRSDLDVNSPYNTRKFAGLPPGPIDSPGAAAIEAAAAPAAGDWIYFVTVNPDTGETLFTSNYQEFLRGKEQFNQWYAQNRDRAGGQPTATP